MCWSGSKQLLSSWTYLAFLFKCNARQHSRARNKNDFERTTFKCSEMIRSMDFETYHLKTNRNKRKTDRFLFYYPWVSIMTRDRNLILVVFSLICGLIRIFFFSWRVKLELTQSYVEGTFAGSSNEESGHGKILLNNCGTSEFLTLKFYAVSNTVIFSYIIL